MIRLICSIFLFIFLFTSCHFSFKNWKAEYYKLHYKTEQMLNEKMNTSETVQNEQVTVHFSDEMKSPKSVHFGQNEQNEQSKMNSSAIKNEQQNEQNEQPKMNTFLNTKMNTLNSFFVNKDSVQIWLKVNSFLERGKLRQTVKVDSFSYRKKIVTRSETIVKLKRDWRDKWIGGAVGVLIGITIMLIAMWRFGRG